MDKPRRYNLNVYICDKQLFCLFGLCFSSFAGIYKKDFQTRTKVSNDFFPWINVCLTSQIVATTRVQISRDWLMLSLSVCLTIKSTQASFVKLRQLLAIKVLLIAFFSSFCFHHTNINFCNLSSFREQTQTQRVSHHCMHPVPLV